MDMRVISKRGVNIRATPNSDSDDNILDTAKYGEVVVAVDPQPEDSDNWTQVVMEDDSKAWIKSEFLEQVEKLPDPEKPEETPAVETPKPGGVIPDGVYDFSNQDGTIRAIIAECQRLGLPLPPQIAYVLATTEWETARTMRPVREAYWVNKDPGLAEKWRRINLARYYPYYGRGFVQLTWEENYRTYSKKTGLDLVNNPDLAMKPEIAVFILVDGFKTGAFTGAKLEKYINEDDTDFYNARRCINGTDKADEIADLAEKYLGRLS